MNETMREQELEYVGFLARCWASLIDTVLLGLVTAPLLWWIYGPVYWYDAHVLRGPADFLISYVVPGVVAVLFWTWRQATPGKMAIRARVVDAQTGGPLTTPQAIGRYFGYFVSIFTLFIGFFWIAFDARKQGFHDKLAGTVVVRPKRPEAVRFETPAR